MNIILGCTGSVLCPVAALLGYIARRGDCPGPFFLDSAAKPLVKARFVTEVHTILVALEVPQDQYAGHSFRIGAAISAALAGVEDSTIQLLGQWQSGVSLNVKSAYKRGCTGTGKFHFWTFLTFAQEDALTKWRVQQRAAFARWSRTLYTPKVRDELYLPCKRHEKPNTC